MRFQRAFSVLFGLPVALALGARAEAQISVPGDFATIQGAVDAAVSGDTILVAAGVYVEQVTIVGKDLSLIGAPGATVQAFPSMVDNLGALTGTKNVLAAFQADVRVSGFTFDGQGLSAPGFFLVGVYLAAAGGAIEGCSFQRFRSTPYGLEFARGVSAFNLAAWHPTQREVAVLGCSFEDGHDAIVMGGDDAAPNDLRIGARILGNTIVGQGGGPLTQRGIWISFGVGGTIQHNSISNHVYADQSEFAVGILAGSSAASFDPPFALVVPSLAIGRNALEGNTVAIACLYSQQSTIENNWIQAGAASLGGIAVSGQGNQVVANKVDMSASFVPDNIGVALLGLEFGGSMGFGVALDTAVALNVIAGADLPIAEQTGVSGTLLRANRILP